MLWWWEVSQSDWSVGMVGWSKDRIHLDYKWAKRPKAKRKDGRIEYRTHFIHVLLRTQCIHSNDLESCFSIHLLTVTFLSVPSKSSKNKTFRIKMMWPAPWSMLFIFFSPKVFEGKVFERVQRESRQTEHMNKMEIEINGVREREKASKRTSKR